MLAVETQALINTDMSINNHICIGLFMRGNAKHDGRSLGRSKLRSYFFAICRPKFIKLNVRVPELSQFATPFIV